MKRSQALLRLASGLQADLSGYDQLQELLDAQFAAALRHRAAELAVLADRITALCAELNARRVERCALIDHLVAAAVAPRQRMDTALGLLPAPHAERACSAWASLGQQLAVCKRANERNCALLMEQHEIMQRVLAPEGETYVPR